MSIANELAKMCVGSIQKRAADPRAIRDEFESSAEREGLGRRHAERLTELSRNRVADEDQSLSGYAATGVNRMLPIPNTGSEALVRGLGTGVGALGGHMLQKSMQPDPHDIKSLFAGKDMHGAMDNIGGMGDLKKSLAVANPSVLHEVFSGAKRAPTFDELKQRIKSVTMPKSFGEAGSTLKNLVHLPTQELKSPGAVDIATQLGDKNLDTMRQEVQHKLKNRKPGAPGSFGSRYGGALAGAGAMALASGIPYAARALWQKHQGGEAAVRARSQAKEETEKADNEGNKREKLLAGLPASGLKKASDLAFNRPDFIQHVLALVNQTL